MSEIAIIGGGIAGMSAALYLVKAGHQVTVYERDVAQPPASTAEAFEWDRRGAPQIRHSHAMLARLRNLFRDDHPEVLEGLMQAGATEMKLYETMPGADKPGVIQDEDREIVFLACRRATLEWVMRTELLKHDALSFNTGAVVSGLQLSQTSTPFVEGLTLEDGRSVKVDTVIAADGRRSAVAKWLQRADISIEETVTPAGIQYFSRFYKLDKGKQVPTTDLVANDLGYLFYAAFCGDSGFYSFALSANEDDAEMKEALKDPQRYERIIKQIPELRPWLECGKPTTDVYPMGGLVNRRRNFLKDGRPLVLGLHAIGDAHICTNPAYGRGLSTAVWQAKLLSEAIQNNQNNPEQQGIDFCQSIEEHIVPWFDISAMMDSGRLQQRELLAETGAANTAAENPLKAVHDAASIDVDVWRDLWRTMNLLQSPSRLMAPDFLERVLAASEKLAAQNTQTDPLAVPDRATLLKSVST